MRLASTAWRVRARRALAGVGLGRHAHRRVDTLDAFERRRVLVARALVTWPQNLVVPEIDDGLGRCDAADVLGVLRTLTRCERMTVLVSATDPVLVQMFADRILRIADAHVGAPRSQVENT